MYRDTVTYGMGRKTAAVPNRAFLLFIMVIGMYALGSVWFILNPKDGINSGPIFPKSHEPRAMSVLKAGIRGYLEDEGKREEELRRQREEEAIKKQQLLDEMNRNKDAVDDFVNRAQDFKNQKRWEDAMRVLDEGLAKFPRSDKILGHKGGWYFDKED